MAKINQNLFFMKGNVLMISQMVMEERYIRVEHIMKDNLNKAIGVDLENKNGHMEIFI